MTEYEIVTAADCDYEKNCAECGLYAWCEDRLSIADCRLCGETYLDNGYEIFCGICKDCLMKYVDPQTIKEYVTDTVTSNNKLWESLFETYFSTADDKCSIDTVSVILRDRLMEQITREFKMDKLGSDFNSKKKLGAWICEDDVSMDNFAAWIVEKKIHIHK